MEVFHIFFYTLRKHSRKEEILLKTHDETERNETLIEGRFMKQLFSVADTGYSVQKIRIYKFDAAVPLVASSRLCRNDTIIISGYMLPVGASNIVEYRGKWLQHEKYGLQFQVSNYKESVDVNNEKSVVRYICSGMKSTGVGPETAKKIYRKFGDNTLNVLKDDPEKVIDIPGISINRAKKLTESFQETESIRENLIFLNRVGISQKLASKISVLYGKNLISNVKSNPYCLYKVSGVSFDITENIAKKINYNMNSKERIKTAIIEALRINELSGHTGCLKSNLLKLVRQVLSPCIPEQKIINEVSSVMIKERMVYVSEKNEQMLIFRPETYNVETNVARKLVFLSDTMNSLNISKLNKDVSEIEKKNGLSLHYNQRKAIISGISNKVTIVTGGPGTGKTSVLNIVSQIYESYYPDKTILMLAPTAKAARRMSESTNRPAFTIHSGLHLTEDSMDVDDDFKLEADFIVVDEFSMVDIWLMNSLLKAIPDTAQVLFVGDINQLPSVQCGAVLKDIIESGCFPVVKLTKIFRQSGDSKILSNSLLINEKSTKIKYGDDFYLKEVDNEHIAAENIVDIFRKMVAQYGINNVVCLSPVRKGITGVNNLNNQIQNRVNPLKNGEIQYEFGNKIFRKGDIVMHLKNAKYCSNGDIGVVLDINVDKYGKYVEVLYSGNAPTNMQEYNIDYIVTKNYSVEVCKDKKGKIAFISSVKMKYYKNDLYDLDLGYAITIHKSQGSEYKCVITTIGHYHPRSLRVRNLLYTAITRAKENLIIVGEKEVMNQCILCDADNRITLLKEKIEYEYKKKCIIHSCTPINQLPL